MYVTGRSVRRSMRCDCREGCLVLTRSVTLGVTWCIEMFSWETDMSQQDRLSRRCFLKATGQNAGVLAAATCLPSFLNNVQASDNSQAERKKTSYYLIGNSLTWDTIPGYLDGDVQWHVGCGKSLPYLFEHPENPCVKSSTLWPNALKNKQYGFVSVQPHYGSNLKQDIKVISEWMKMQPEAVLVIHSGWALATARAQEYASKETTKGMVHSPAYFGALITELKALYPTRHFRQTGAIDLLDRIARDIKNGKAPFKSMEELHRDKIHMKMETGRYLMHNAMRIALGQPISDKGFEKTREEHKQYFNTLLKARG